jgi:molybdopterin-guanine dinucleotide biosynthesis protein A
VAPEFPVNPDGNIRIELITFPDRAGWVLAGGRSQRMRSDKALVEIGGRPLVLRVADELSKVCGFVGIAGDPAKYQQLGLPVVADEFPGAGPLAGIEASLRHTSAPWNLIAACDMPALTPEIFEMLFAAEADCTVPRYEDGDVEPLCAVYHRRCHPAVREALESGVRRVTEALRRLEIRYVQVASSAPFVNLNTPEDLRKYTNG